jgi:hypothetical protein
VHSQCRFASANWIAMRIILVVFTALPSCVIGHQRQKARLQGPLRGATRLK